MTVILVSKLIDWVSVNKMTERGSGIEKNKGDEPPSLS